jgi:AraC-like DNA-binding protein
VAERDGLQSGEPAAATGAAEQNRQVVGEQLAAAAGEDGQAAGEACLILLAPVGGEPSDAPPFRVDGTADRVAAPASRIGQLIRTFKSIYGKTPHQYLMAMRVEEAKEMLDQGVTVTEACFAVGFNSLGSFTELFKRRVGLTPSAYRRQRLKRQAEIRRAPLKFIPGCFAALFG